MGFVLDAVISVSSSSVYTIAFVHGLESGRRGRKAQMLATRYGIRYLGCMLQPPFPFNLILLPFTWLFTVIQLWLFDPSCVIASSFGGILMWYLLICRLWHKPVLFLGLPTHVCFGYRLCPRGAAVFLFGNNDRFSTTAQRHRLGKLGMQVKEVPDDHALNNHLHLIPVLCDQIMQMWSEKTVHNDACKSNTNDH